jgi:hypothetical protein
MTAGKSTSSETIAKKDKFVLLKEDYFYFGMHPYKKKGNNFHIRQPAYYTETLYVLNEVLVISCKNNLFCK